MKKSVALSAFLVLGLLLTSIAWGAGVKTARADQGEGEGSSMEVQAQAGASASSGISNQDSLEHQLDAAKNALEHQADQMKNEAEHSLEATSSDEQNQEMEQEDVAATSTEALRASIEHRQAELDAEASSTDNGNAQENEHGMSLAVHALLASRTLLGGIGPEVSVLARQLGNSTTSTAEAEAKIASRGWFARLFFGGDQQSAADIQTQVDKNKTDIQQLQNLISGCGSCSAEVKTLLQDQLNVALAEQTRLQAMAQAEIDARGIFGTILGWFGK